MTREMGWQLEKKTKCEFEGVVLSVYFDMSAIKVSMLIRMSQKKRK